LGLPRLSISANAEFRLWFQIFLSITDSFGDPRMPARSSCPSRTGKQWLRFPFIIVASESPDVFSVAFPFSSGTTPSPTGVVSADVAALDEKCC